MRVNEHPTPADLARYLVAREDLDARVVAVRTHLVDHGCATCLAEVRRLAGKGCEEAVEAPGSKTPDHWITPRKISLTGGGYRGLGGGDLQLMCRAGGYEVDVVVRMRGVPAHLEIVGQVTRAARMYEPIAGLTLQLVKPDDQVPVLATRTDEFGEFDFLSLTEAVYGIRLGERKEDPCVLVWSGGN